MSFWSITENVSQPTMSQLKMPEQMVSFYWKGLITDNVFLINNWQCLTTNNVWTENVWTDNVFLLKMSCNRQCLFTTYLILSLLTLSCNRNYLVLDFRKCRRDNTHTYMIYFRPVLETPFSVRDKITIPPLGKFCQRL